MDQKIVERKRFQNDRKEYKKWKPILVYGYSILYEIIMQWFFRLIIFKAYIENII